MEDSKWQQCPKCEKYIPREWKEHYKCGWKPGPEAQRNVEEIIKNHERLIAKLHDKYESLENRMLELYEKLEWEQ